MRQLSLFSMIFRRPQSWEHSKHQRLPALLSIQKGWNWFGQVALHHPLQLLDGPPEKEEFKKTVKLNIAEYWQQHYRNKIVKDNFSSLEFFKADF